MKIIALIPARSGSKRCPGKNTRMFFGHPLIAYTIKAAQESGIFDEILVSTDSQETIEIATSYGVGAILRPADISRDTSTDLEWVNHALSNIGQIRNKIESWLCQYDAFAILRPTSPFRSAALIRDAWGKFKGSSFDSLRTMEMRDHPGKMWEFEARNKVYPFKDGWAGIPYSYDLPTQALFRKYPVFTQNGCLQIARTSLLPQTITGSRVYGYDMTGGLQGFDINTELDWILAEELVKRGMVELSIPLSLAYTNKHISDEAIRQSVQSSTKIERG